MIATPRHQSLTWGTNKVESLDCRTVNFSGNRKVIDCLEPAKRIFSLRTRQAVDRALIVSECRQLPLDRANQGAGVVRHYRIRGGRILQRATVVRVRAGIVNRVIEAIIRSTIIPIVEVWMPLIEPMSPLPKVSMKHSSAATRSTMEPSKMGAPSSAASE